MGLIKDRIADFKEYSSMMRKDSAKKQELISAYREKRGMDDEYRQFKENFLGIIDKLFDNVLSKLYISPNEKKMHLFEKLLEDDNFTRYYKYEITKDNVLIITRLEVW